MWVFGVILPNCSLILSMWSTADPLSRMHAPRQNAMPSTRSKSPIGPLRDMLENIELARTFVADKTFDNFQSDRRTSYAVLRCLEIISEASRRLPADLKA